MSFPTKPLHKDGVNIGEQRNKRKREKKKEKSRACTLLHSPGFYETPYFDHTPYPFIVPLSLTETSKFPDKPGNSLQVPDVFPFRRFSPDPSRESYPSHE